MLFIPEASAVAIGQSSAEMALRDPDIYLMLRVREDEPGAFTSLVERYQHRLLAVLQNLIGNAEEAEDLAQEVFLRIYRSRKKYSPTAKLSTWLFTIANHLALNAIRNRQRRAALPLRTDESSVDSPKNIEGNLQGREASPSTALRHSELADRIRQALDTLNDRQRMALVLNKFEEMNYADIAEVMGLTVKAVKSLLSRARASMRQALMPYLGLESNANAFSAEDAEGEE
jgi:RNA polymerase sigma-70 factor, ECF subfamily